MATFIKPQQDMTAPLDTTLEAEALEDERVWVETVTGHHSMSGLYEYEIGLQTAIGSLPRDCVEALLRGGLKLISAKGTEDESVVHGIARSVVMDSHADIRDAVHYRITMVPRLWLTTQTVRTRLFQSTTVPGIVKTVLQDHGLAEGDDFDLLLDRRHPQREYVVQYRETDYALVSRLLEHEGIFFWFDQTEKREKLMIADINEAFRPLTGSERIGYDARSGAVTTPVVRSLSQRIERRPKQTAVWDYNYRTPSITLRAEVDVDPEGTGTVMAYGEHVKDPDDCRRIAKLRAEAIRCTQEVFDGRSTVRGLRPGVRFTLEGHPAQDLDGDYLVIDVEHLVDQRAETSGKSAASRAIDARRSELIDAAALSYGNAFRAVKYATPWRPAMVTPKPRVVALMHARIDGTDAGARAPVDAQGRYQVWLPFDMGKDTGGHAVRWTRMAQAHAGPGYGVHLPLSVGAEVLLEHIDGDPDRPIIVGTVPNPEMQSPVNETNAVEGVIRTRNGIAIRMINSTGALPRELKSASSQGAGPRAPDAPPHGR